MAPGTDQTLSAPIVLLLGASSQIGVFAIPQLILAGFHVLAVSRKGRPENYPVFKQVDWLDEADVIQTAHSCQYLLSAGPMELAKKFLCGPRHPTPVTPETAPVPPDTAPVTPDTTPVTPGSTRGPFKTAIIFSSSSVATKQKSGNPAERAQIEAMLALESDLQSTAENGGTKLVIFRPTLIYGCGLDTNITRLAVWIRRFGFMPVNGKAAGLRQPVHAEDLASVAVNAMLAKDPMPQVLSLAGGDTLSYSEMVSRIFTAMGKPSRLVRLPQWLFVLLVRFAATTKIGEGTNTEMVKRQAVDLVFDDQQARMLLDYNPRPFAPVSDDFCLPKFR